MKHTQSKNHLIVLKVPMNVYIELPQLQEGLQEILNELAKGIHANSIREKHWHRVTEDYRYNDIIFDNRDDAEEVLFQMKEILSDFGTITVADMKDLAGISSDYRDNKYGWTDLNHTPSYVERVRDGYVIKLPRATVL